MRQNSTNNVISNFIWRAMERFGAQGITFVVSLILARLLDPDVYGVLALVTVFTVLLEVFQDAGLGNALIQKQNADDLDFSTIFYFNVAFSLVLYLLLFAAAPIIAAFYRMSELTELIRVMGLVVIISGVKNIQVAYVSRNMLFKKFFFSTLGGTLGAAVVGIAMAYYGFGVWALIAQILFNNLVDTVILWITVSWRPKWMFSWERFRGLFSYGSKLLAASLLATLYNNLRHLVIGKMYTTESLAFYNQGEKLPSFLVNNINTAIDSVLLPVLATEQTDVPRVRELTRRAIQVSSYVMWPVMMGFSACAEPLVRLVLTDKWLPCVPFLRICCITFAFYPIHTANLNAIKALGYSGTLLKLEIMKKAAGFLVLLGTMWYGPYVMALSGLATSLISQIINSWPNRKLLNYSYWQQLMDILPSAALAVAMFAAVYAVSWLHLPDIVSLLIQIPLGVVIYVAGSYVFRIEPFGYMLGMLTDFVKDGRKGKNE